jgi:hypothetical protein
MPGVYLTSPCSMQCTESLETPPPSLETPCQAEEEPGLPPAKRRRVHDAAEHTIQERVSAAFRDALHKWVCDVLTMTMKTCWEPVVPPLLASAKFEMSIAHAETATHVAIGIANELGLWTEGFASRPDVYVALWIGMKWACLHRPCSAIMVRCMAAEMCVTTVAAFCELEVEMLRQLDWNVARFCPLFIRPLHPRGKTVA